MLYKYFFHNIAPREMLFHDFGWVYLKNNLSDEGELAVVMLKGNVDVTLNIRLIWCEVVALMRVYVYGGKRHVAMQGKCKDSYGNPVR
jgi:hypothetical protein